MDLKNSQEMKFSQIVFKGCFSLAKCIMSLCCYCKIDTGLDRNWNGHLATIFLCWSHYEVIAQISIELGSGEPKLVRYSWTP